MWVEGTVLQVWGMRTLCEAGGSGPMLDVLMGLADQIEVETAEGLSAWGMVWSPKGLTLPADESHRDEVVGLELTAQEIEALAQAYYGGREVPAFVWRQGLPEDFRRAARSLGPVLREWLEEARVEAQLQAMPERVRARLAEKAKEQTPRGTSAVNCRVVPSPPVNGGGERSPSGGGGSG